ncbi:hypothetical protein [Kocuria sp.]|nr:hypothetical protein [Kocuria sp.]
METPDPTSKAPTPVFNHASFIWGAANILRGTYKQHQYGDVLS